MNQDEATGAVGQVGSALTVRLRKIPDGNWRVVAVFMGIIHLAYRRHREPSLRIKPLWPVATPLDLGRQCHPPIG